MEPIRQLPVEQQITFWIKQLTRRGKSGPSELDKVFHFSNPSYPAWGTECALDELERIGERAIVPMLKMLRTLANLPEWEGDRPSSKISETSVSGVVISTIFKIQEAAQIPAEAETLLHQVFRAACKANEGRELWGTLPFHTALCLKKKFPGYPSPGQSGNNAPILVEAFKRRPKKP